MNRFFHRLVHMTPNRVVALFILLWLGVAVALALNGAPRAWLLAYGAVTLVYAFFVASWAMLRTMARLRGVLDEGVGPDGGLLLESLPCAAFVLDAAGIVYAANNQWLDVAGMPRSQIIAKHYKNFCDPALKRVIDHCRHAKQPAEALNLSTRTPAGENILFVADVREMGDHWLVTARVTTGATARRENTETAES